MILARFSRIVAAVARDHVLDHRLGHVRLQLVRLACRGARALRDAARSIPCVDAWNRAQTRGSARAQHVPHDARNTRPRA
eukprot:1672436-Pleurochrysis_carterae.AAC.3